MRKDYRSEAAIVDGLARARCPGASSLLDVGCGTGLHLEQFAQLYDDVAGIDLAPDFVRRARERCGASSRVTVGDMRSFDLKRTFDVVTCLFSGIGHVGDEPGLHAAVAAMARHVAPGGVLLVEPWRAAGDGRDGEFGVQVAEAPGSTLVRANQTSSDGDVSVVQFAWTEVTATRITRADEQLRLTRFTDEQLRGAFEAAGLDASFDARGCNDDRRGLWIGLN
ncbi:MAG: class I SAM-dependent methyltransferase [Gaiellales bacterium]